MSERTSLTFWCFILHLALVPVHPVLGSDAGEGHLIYLPDESENIKFSAVAHALPHIDGTEYVWRPPLSGRWAQDLPEWSNEAVLSSDLHSHNSSRVLAVAISGIASEWSWKAMTRWPNTKQTSGNRSNLWCRNLSPVVWELWPSTVKCTEHPGEEAALQGFQLPFFWERIFRIAMPMLGHTQLVVSLWPSHPSFASEWAMQLIHWKRSMPCFHAPHFCSLSSLGCESQIWHLGSPTQTAKQQLDSWRIAKKQ